MTKATMAQMLDTYLFRSTDPTDNSNDLDKQIYNGEFDTVEKISILVQLSFEAGYLRAKGRYKTTPTKENNV